MSPLEGYSWSHETKTLSRKYWAPSCAYAHTQSMSLCANGDRWGMKLSDPYSVVLEALVGGLLFVNVLIRLCAPPV